MNVILIISDTFRCDNLFPAGDSLVRTPFLLAAPGLPKGVTSPGSATSTPRPTPSKHSGNPRALI